MLSNAHFLAKIRFDTAENEPAKKLQDFANFPNFANPNPEPQRPGQQTSLRELLVEHQGGGLAEPGGEVLRAHLQDRLEVPDGGLPVVGLLRFVVVAKLKDAT